MKPIVSVMLVAASTIAVAQEDPLTGRPPFGTFSDGAFDGVNLQSLNANFIIPVYQGRGRGTDFAHVIAFDSLVWRRGGNFWSPVTDETGAPNWGWKGTRPTGTIKKASYSEWCYNVWANRYYGFSYTDPQGTLHRFDLDFYKYPLMPPDPATGESCELPTGPRTGEATDNSGYTIDASMPNLVKVRDPEGRVIKESGTEPDPNGNLITYVAVGANETDWVDTLGRTALKVVKNAGNTEFKTLDHTGTYQTYRLNYSTKSVRTNFGCSGVIEYVNANASLPTSLELPTGQSYSFYYEPTPGYATSVTGRLRKVVLPSGGYIQYDYNGSNGGVDCADGTPFDLTRTLNDGTTSSVWRYQRQSIPTGSLTTETLPQLPYQGAPNQNTHEFNGIRRVAIQRIFEGPASGTPLRTITTAYATNGTPASRTIKIEGGVSPRELFTDLVYDDSGFLLSSTERNGPLATDNLRKTVYTYLRTTPYIDRNIRNRLSRVEVFAYAGNQWSLKQRQDIAYDTTPLTEVLGAPQHSDAAYGTSMLVRGNVTAVTTHKDPAVLGGAVTKSFHYDTLGNLVRGNSDCCGEQRWQFSPVHAYAYPASIEQGPIGQASVTQYLYDAETGAVESITEENGRVTAFTQDVVGRLRTVSRPDGMTTEYVYNDSGRTMTVIEPINGTSLRQTVVTYDGLGRTQRLRVTDVGGSQTYTATDIQYDAFDREYKRSEPYISSPTKWTELRYDALGRITLAIPPDGSPTSNRTEAVYVGRQETITDPAGAAIQRSYDLLGRLEWSKERKSNTDAWATTWYGFTITDKLASASSPEGAGRSITYDGLDRVASEYNPESGTTSYQYGLDAFGSRVTRRTDAAGAVTDYGYDALGRLTDVTYTPGASGAAATPPLHFAYGTNPATNTVGRVATVTDGIGSESFEYDAMGRLTKSTRVIDSGVGAGSYVTQYSYDGLGGITEIVYPSLRRVRYVRDAVGRLTRVEDDTRVYAQNFSYNAKGSPTGLTFGNGVTGTFQYEPNRGLLSSIDYSRSGNGLLRLQYAYTQPNGGNNGRVTQVTDQLVSARTESFAYDSMNRLKAASTATWGLSWTYDNNGNRITQSATLGTPPTSPVGYQISGAKNRVTTSGWTYDARGNLTARPGATMKYDVEGDRVEWRAQPSGAIVTNEYDSRSEVVRRTSTGGSINTTRISIRSGLGVFAEYEGAPPTLATENIYANGRLIASIAGGSVTYNHHDHLSVRVITDAAGNVVRERGHYPFGEMWYSSGSGMSDEPWVFTTYYRDDDSGSDYAIAREFVPGEGRFDSPDAFGGDPQFPQSLNRYSYSLNDPVNLVDPSGELCYGWHIFVTYTVNGIPIGREYFGFFPVRCLSPDPGHGTELDRLNFAKGVAKQLFTDQQLYNRLKDCVTKVFGKDAPKALKKIDPKVNPNPPTISFKEGYTTGRWLNYGERDADGGATLAFGYSFGAGEVHINPNYVSLKAPYVSEFVMAAYVHEYGNILDWWLNPNRRRSTYGDGVRFVDPDTGNVLEDCFMGGLYFDPWKGAIPTPRN